MPYRKCTLQLCVALLALCWAQDAEAIITRDDVPDASYVVPDADYPAVVDLFEPGDCIGTLITTQHLLTVAHCAEDLTVCSRRRPSVFVVIVFVFVPVFVGFDIAPDIGDILGDPDAELVVRAPTRPLASKKLPCSSRRDISRRKDEEGGRDEGREEREGRGRRKEETGRKG